MANTELVGNLSGTIDRHFIISDSSDDDDIGLSKHQHSTSLGRKISSIGFAIIRKSFEDKTISERATDIMLAAWKPSSQKQFSVYIRR